MIKEKVMKLKSRNSVVIIKERKEKKKNGSWKAESVGQW